MLLVALARIRPGIYCPYARHRHQPLYPLAIHFYACGSELFGDAPVSIKGIALPDITYRIQQINILNIGQLDLVIQRTSINV